MKKLIISLNNFKNSQFMLTYFLFFLPVNMFISFNKYIFIDNITHE